MLSNEETGAKGLRNCSSGSNMPVVGRELRQLREGVKRVLGEDLVAPGSREIIDGIATWAIFLGLGLP